MPDSSADHRSLLQALLGDGRFLLSLTGMALFAAGGFAIFQSITGQLLPHDVHALGMNSSDLSRQTNQNLVRFMFHDRVAFGGVLLAIGTAYWWLAEFPLRAGAVWAWWTLALSGGLGFLTFLSYLGYGYLDTWHGVATAFLLPVYLAGLWRSRRLIHGPLHWKSIWERTCFEEPTPAAIGRGILFFCAAGILVAGLTILIVGMTFVFVSTDVNFIGIAPDKLRAVSPTLVPLLAHDRAGFGGGLFSFGLVLVMMMRHAPVSRSLVEVVAIMGIFGFASALGVHFAIGYTTFMHLAPAYAGLSIFLAGTGLLAKGHFSERAIAAAH